jgi:Homeodomain-like domain
MEKYTLKLDIEERETLLRLIKVGKAAAYTQRHARILVAIDESMADGKRSDEAIAESLHVDERTIRRVRERCVLYGVAAAIERKAYERSRLPILQGKEEAHLIALCCSPPPEGRKRWTMQLLADKLISLEVVDTVSAMTVCRTLKKTN